MIEYILLSYNFIKPSLEKTFDIGISSTSKVISRTLSEQEDIDVVEKWDLLSAVCLERHPVITKPMLDIEARYQNMLRQKEYENSMISDFEIRKQKDISRSTQASAEKTDNIISKEIIQDIEDSWEEEFKNFKFAPRISGMYLRMILFF